MLKSRQYYAKSWAIILQAVASAMQMQDKYILSVIHGQEAGDLVVPNNNSEPAAFFFVIYGLVYEALASATDTSSVPSQHQSAVLGSLQTLKSLVKPEYAGKAIMEPTIFDEFISVCYRIAMTETASVQTHLIEVLTVFATSQDPPGLPGCVF